MTDTVRCRGGESDCDVFTGVTLGQSRAGISSLGQYYQRRQYVASSPAAPLADDQTALGEQYRVVEEKTATV